MKDTRFILLENEMIAKNTYLMRLSGDTSETRAGGFVNIRIDGFYLRRPISVCDWDGEKGTLTIIYKVVGHGTEYMSKLGEGAVLDVLVGLGNGFDTAKSGENPVVIGGGVGVPPMYGLAKRLAAQNIPFSVILGFNTKDEIFYE